MKKHNHLLRTMIMAGAVATMALAQTDGHQRKPAGNNEAGNDTSSEKSEMVGGADKSS